MNVRLLLILKVSFVTRLLQIRLVLFVKRFPKYYAYCVYNPNPNDPDLIQMFTV